MALWVRAEARAEVRQADGGQFWPKNSQIDVEGSGVRSAAFCILDDVNICQHGESASEGSCGGQFSGSFNLLLVIWLDRLYKQKSHPVF